MSYRYRVEEGSQSAHCCFVATVVDTKNVTFINDEGTKIYETVCECFTISDAAKIATALNKTEQQA